MHKIISILLVIVGILFTAFGGIGAILLDSTWIQQYLIMPIGFSIIPLVSIPLGAILVWSGGLFRAHTFHRWAKIFLCSAYSIALIFCVLITLLFISLGENFS